MKIEDELKGMIIANYGSIKNFAEYTNVPYQTIVSILLRGLNSGKFGNVAEISRALSVSMDDLANDRLTSVNIIVPPNKKRNLRTLLIEYIRLRKEGGSFILDDELLTNEEFEIFTDQFQVAMELIRLRRLKKSNPDITKEELIK